MIKIKILNDSTIILKFLSKCNSSRMVFLLPSTSNILFIQRNLIYCKLEPKKLSSS